MSNKETGGPAFPSEHSRCQNGREDGMTLRDYFAAKAMQGRIHLPIPPYWEDKDDKEIALSLAEFSYAMADAMLKARKE